MGELLIELLCEEIPAMMQKKAETAYIDIFKKYFQYKEVNFDHIETFVGPRRIVIYVNGLSDQISKNISIKGPKINAPTAAIDGFCKSNNIDKKELIIKKVKGQDCYFYETEIAGQNTAKILESSLHEPIMEYIWPKSMYWGDYKIKWIRPIRNILCLFNGEVIPFKLGHLTANTNTSGHKFLGRWQEVKNFSHYQEVLKENFVILSSLERTKIISEAMQAKARELNLQLQEDPVLLEEVSGLVEFPVVMLGAIDRNFLKLPSEILSSSMRTHQKYFSLFDKEGSFAPYFLFVSNINPANQASVIKGNEKVLSARLSDALYFYNQDATRTLESRIENLDNVVFHAKLGSLKAKIERLEKLVQFIDPTSIASFEAARICKSDILTEAVSEFPNLQGIMGYYYALSEGKDEQVAIAIRDHYKPQGPLDSAPLGDAAILALADKIDSLCGLMIAGEKPTGSKDPYALRRLALGTIRIILENNLKVNMTELVEFSCRLYKQAGIADQDLNFNLQNEIDSILLFIEERAKNYFKDNFDTTYINAAVDLNTDSDLVTTKKRLEALALFLEEGAFGNNLLNSYKRAGNILAGKSPQGTVEEKYFTLPYENALFEILARNTKQIEQAVSEQKFLLALEILASMSEVIASFFDNVMVMDSNPALANNRLLLLAKTKAIFDKIANFDVL